jgi:hypothetical protein
VLIVGDSIGETAEKKSVYSHYSASPISPYREAAASLESRMMWAGLENVLS